MLLYHYVWQQKQQQQQSIFVEIFRTAPVRKLHIVHFIKLSIFGKVANKTIAKILNLNETLRFTSVVHFLIGAGNLDKMCRGREYKSR